MVLRKLAYRRVKVWVSRLADRLKIPRVSRRKGSGTVCPSRATFGAELVSALAYFFLVMMI